MAEFFCKKSDWLITTTKMGVGDVIVIHPRDGLTMMDVQRALLAQFPYKKDQTDRPSFYLNDHGSKFFIDRRR